MSDFYTQYVNLKNVQSFQSVYASQVYGTFFTVNARFHTDENHPEVLANPDKDLYFITKIDFRVINYKGILNIGLQDVEPPSNFMSQVNEVIPSSQENSVKAFKLVTRAMGGFDGEGSEQPKLDFPLDMNMLVNPGDTLYFRRVQKHLHSDESDEHNGIFDDEFWYRDGLNRSQRVLPPRPDQEMVDFGAVQFGFASGPLCPESHNIVM